VRIIAGLYKGQTIQAVRGASTRPTTDRVREAWASTLCGLLPEGFEGARVLDAFAGSGALGLEALSRGAKHVVFCERDPRALRTLRANVGLFDPERRTTSVLALDVLAPKAVRPLKEAGPYNLVILDPPYAYPAGRVQGLLHSLAVTGSLVTAALVAYEHRAGESDGLDGCVLCSACSPASLRMVSCKTYGTTRIDYLCYR
jgi:16S rRNA (guanine966-N2)-methyltransferase